MANNRIIKDFIGRKILVTVIIEVMKQISTNWTHFRYSWYPVNFDLCVKSLFSDCQTLEKSKFLTWWWLLM